MDTAELRPSSRTWSDYMRALLALSSLLSRASGDSS